MKVAFPHSLARRIVFVIVAATLAATLLLIPAIYLTLREGMQGQRQRHLAGVRTLVERLLAENRRTVSNYAALFATDRQIKDNLYYFSELAGEREHPLNAVRHLVEAFGLAHVELGDRFGRMVVDTDMPEESGGQRAADPLIAAALDGRTATGIKPYRDGFLLMGVAPIFHDEGQLIGSIGVGVLLDNGFTSVIKALSGAEIVIADRNGRVVAASRPALAAEKKMDFDLEKMVHARQEFQVISLPFADFLDRPLGNVLIMAPDTFASLLRRTSLAVVVVLMATALISIAATSLMLRRVLAPIGALREGAEKIGRGRFEHRIDITGRDEIGGLAEVFNRMAENLQNMRNVEEKLRHAERLAAIGEFTAATAHELNNPIANIVGLAKVIRKDLSGNDLLAEDLDLIVRQANRCGAIVRDLLVYSRSQKPSREWVDGGKLMEEAIRAVRQRYLNGREIDLSFESPPAGAGNVFVDPIQMEQVFINLLANAAQAVSGKGEIGVSLTVEGDGICTATVTDTGRGIAEENLGKLFYPFFTTKKTGEGTGLGLAVCHTIVQAHGGTITAANRPGGGAVFTVTLPGGETHD